MSNESEELIFNQFDLLSSDLDEYWELVGGRGAMTESQQQEMEFETARQDTFVDDSQMLADDPDEKRETSADAPKSLQREGSQYSTRSSVRGTDPDNARVHGGHGSNQSAGSGNGEGDDGGNGENPPEARPVLLVDDLALALKMFPFMAEEDEVLTHKRMPLLSGNPEILELRLDSMQLMESFVGFVGFFYSSGLAARGGVIVRPPNNWNGGFHHSGKSDLSGFVPPRMFTYVFLKQSLNPYACLLKRRAEPSNQNLQRIFDSTAADFQPLTSTEAETRLLKYVQNKEKMRFCTEMDNTSLFPDFLTCWNPNKLQTDLQDPMLIKMIDVRVLKEPNRQSALLAESGFTTPLQWFGSAGSVIPLQKQRHSCGTLIYNNKGKDVFFYVVSPHHMMKLENAIGEVFPEETGKCAGFLEHKRVLVHEKFFHDYEISYSKVVLEENKFLVISAGAYFQAISMGPAVLEIIGYSTRATFPIMVFDNYFCRCGICTRFLKKELFVMKYNIDWLADFRRKELVVPHPFEDNLFVPVVHDSVKFEMIKNLLALHKEKTQEAVNTSKAVDPNAKSKAPQSHSRLSRKSFIKPVKRDAVKTIVLKSDEEEESITETEQDSDEDFKPFSRGRGTRKSLGTKKANELPARKAGRPRKQPGEPSKEQNKSKATAQKDPKKVESSSQRGKTKASVPSPTLSPPPTKRRKPIQSYTEVDEGDADFTDDPNDPDYGSPETDASSDEKQSEVEENVSKFPEKKKAIDQKQDKEGFKKPKEITDKSKRELKKKVEALKKECNEDEKAKRVLERDASSDSSPETAKARSSKKSSSQVSKKSIGGKSTSAASACKGAKRGDVSKSPVGKGKKPKPTETVRRQESDDEESDVECMREEVEEKLEDLANLPKEKLEKLLKLLKK